MANEIVQFDGSESSKGGSPFDSIRRVDEQGEFWSARELMSVLEYVEWRKFSDSIDRAKESLKAAKYNDFDHIVPSDKLIEAGKGAKRRVLDYRLSRFGCYMVAMNGDPRKPQIASAQTYFAAKTREAETVIPEQNARLRELQLVNKNLEMQLRLVDLTNTMTILHGVPTTLLLLGKGDHVEEVEKPTIEIIDERHNVKFEGQTTKQVAEYLNKKYGTKFKSGAEVVRRLKQAKKDGLLAQSPRTILADYIPVENLDEAYRILTQGERQKLIGE